MKANQVSVVVLTIFASIMALIAIATDEWVTKDDDTMNSIGLFSICKERKCSSNFTTIAVTTSALFVSGIVELLLGSIVIFVGWNKSRTFFENLGLFLILAGTIQFCSGATIFTCVNYELFPSVHYWGLSFALAWGASGASLVATFLALWVFFKHHKVVVTILSKKEKTRTPKTAFVKEQRV